MNRIEVLTSESIDSNDKKKIEKLFSEKYGDDYEVYYKVNQEIIGGIIIKDGDRIYDGSIKSQLKKIKRSLLQG